MKETRSGDRKAKEGFLWVYDARMGRKDGKIEGGKCGDVESLLGSDVCLRAIATETESLEASYLPHVTLPVPLVVHEMTCSKGSM